MRFNKVSFEQYKKSVGGDEELKQEYDDILIPKRATKGSAGYDFYMPFSVDIEPNETLKIPTGIRWISNDTDTLVLKIYIRSSLGFKYQINLVNGTGIVDEDYFQSDNEGHIFIKLVNRGDKTIHLDKGQGFAQGIIQNFYMVDNDETTEERHGGFGSTDK